MHCLMILTKWPRHCKLWQDLQLDQTADKSSSMAFRAVGCLPRSRFARSALIKIHSRPRTINLQDASISLPGPEQTSCAVPRSSTSKTRVWTREIHSRILARLFRCGSLEEI